MSKFDGPVKSQKWLVFVIPINLVLDLIGERESRDPVSAELDSRFRGSDGLGDFLRHLHSSFFIIQKSVFSITLGTPNFKLQALRAFLPYRLKC